MYRATTPVIKFKFPASVDLSTAVNMFVTIEGEHGPKITKSGADVSVSGSLVSIVLTQQESLSLPIGKAYGQVNWLFYDAGKLRRACTNQITLKVKGNMLDRVLGE